MSGWAAELVQVLRKSDSDRVVFAGLSKNVGKTTAINAVNLWFANQPVGITSIGYDGENKDALYGHPKPPVKIYSEQMVLTAERFFANSPCTNKEKFTEVERWGGHPQFGDWLILKALDGSAISVAGPSSLQELEEGIQHLHRLGVKRIHIDGALDRLSHVLLNDANIVLSIGAAIGSSLQEVAERAVRVLEYFTLPVAGMSVPDASTSAYLWEGQWHCLPGILWRIDWRETLPAQPEAIYLSGAFTDSLYFSLRQKQRLPVRFYLDSPAQILLSFKVWQGLKARGIDVCLRRRPKLVFLTLSPWHPIRPIPTEEMAREILPFCPVPLVDVIEQKIWSSSGSM